MIIIFIAHYKNIIITYNLYEMIIFIANNSIES